MGLGWPPAAGWPQRARVVSTPGICKVKVPDRRGIQRNSVFFTVIEADLFYIYPLRSGKPGSNTCLSALSLSF